MISYILRRLALMIPTLWVILTINFFIIQLSPGGPVEQMIAKLSNVEGSILDNITSNSSELKNPDYEGSKGLDNELIEEIKKLYGFDKPILDRYFLMIKNYLAFEFGDSFFRNTSVIDLIKEKLPVSITLGIFSTVIAYLISIPLGIKKAVKNGSRFDIYSSSVIIVANAIPTFLFAIILIVLFAGGEYFKIFPLRGLVSDNFDELSTFEKMKDYLHHITLPIIALSIGSFATLTMLTKNSFLDEINKQYVITAKAKGLSNRAVMFGHVFRNAMLLIISGFPSMFISMFFTGSLLIEIIFSLDGLGLLGFESAINRDYPVMFASLYIFTLMGLFISLVSDILYMIIDPRIDFEVR